MASNDDDSGARDAKRRRLRIPAALAVAIVGTSATVAIGIAGCDTGPPEPIDATSSGTARIDGAVDTNIDSCIDGQTMPFDAALDAPPDAPVT